MGTLWRRPAYHTACWGFAQRQLPTHSNRGAVPTAHKGLQTQWQARRIRKDSPLFFAVPIIAASILAKRSELHVHCHRECGVHKTVA